MCHAQYRAGNHAALPRIPLVLYRPLAKRTVSRHTDRPPMSICSVNRTPLCFHFGAGGGHSSETAVSAFRVTMHIYVAKVRSLPDSQTVLLPKLSLSL